MPFGIESVLGLGGLQGQIANAIGRPAQGAMPTGVIPRAPQLPIQMPQLTQLPPFLPPVFGQGMMRDRMMGQVLGPLMRPNFGLPPAVSPIGGGQGQVPVSTGLGGRVTIPRPTTPAGRY